jgi:hypothetical protein
MAVTVYRSSDAAAPVLSGQAGALLAVLDACLVNGYGAKAAAGWTKPFVNAGNKGCYRGGSGAQMSVAIDDSASLATSGAREAQMRGYEVLTSVSAGNGPFPTVAQVANSGLIIRKSQTADATANPWVVVADDKTFYLFIDTKDFTGYGGYMFGDVYSLKAGDLYRAMIVGRIQSAGNVVTPLDSGDNLQTLFGDSVSIANTTGHYMPRNAIGDIQSGMQVGKHGDGVKGVNQLLVTQNRIGNGAVVYPNLTDGGAVLAKVWVHESIGTMNLRGRMRGFWQWCHPVGAPINDGDTFAGTGDLAGKTFLCIKPVAQGDGLFILETSNTWETSA